MSMERKRDDERCCPHLDAKNLNDRIQVAVGSAEVAISFLFNV